MNGEAMAWLASASEADLFARLAVLIKHPAEKLPDLLSLPEPIRTETITELFEDAEWVQNPDYKAEVVAVASAIGAAAGVASGLAGAGTAFAGLAKAL